MRDEEGERDDRSADEGRVEVAGNSGRGGGRGDEVAVAELAAAGVVVGGHGGPGGGGRGVVKKS